MKVLFRYLIGLIVGCSAGYFLFIKDTKSSNSNNDNEFTSPKQTEYTKNQLDSIEKEKKKQAELAEYNRKNITITHESENDWDRDATMRKIGEKVWNACHNNPDAEALTIEVIDVCNDSYGNKSKVVSKIKIKKKDIAEYAKYQDSYSFNANCYDWGIVLIDQYKPCGASMLNGL